MPDESNFRVGAITRLKLANFLHISQAEFTFYSGVNILAGPNGSGKSAILAAISLGTGAAARFIDSRYKPGDFIKNDEEQASIEVS